MPMMMSQILKSVDFTKTQQEVQGLQPTTLNLGSKESAVVNFKEGICTELCLLFWSESDWYFYIAKTCFFESNSPERKF